MLETWIQDVVQKIAENGILTLGFTEYLLLAIINAFGFIIVIFPVDLVMAGALNFAPTEKAKAKVVKVFEIVVGTILLVFEALLAFILLLAIVSKSIDIYRESVLDFAVCLLKKLSKKRTNNMKYEKIYENMTGVNLQQQEREWTERGKGYYGEYLVFHELFQCIPGCAKFLMNLEVPKANGDTTEIDLVCIHETGIYVFEIKHYKGTIYGSETQKEWVQFFRTVKNNHFYNPVLQNKGHIEALKYNLPGKTFYSYVVFTNPEVNLRIKGTISANLCQLDILAAGICNAIRGSKKLYTLDEVEQIYNTLLPYSKVQQASVPLDNSYMSLDKFLTVLGSEKESMQEEMKNFKKKATIGAIAASAIAIGVAACIAIGAIWNVKASTNRMIEQYQQITQQAQNARAAAEDELDDMRSKFSYVAPLNGDDIIITSDMVTVSDFSITASKDIENAVVLNGTINITSDKYGLCFEKAKIIVQLTDGNVLEYDLPKYNSGNIGFLDFWAYHNESISLSRNGHTLQLNNLQPENIYYIKLQNVELCQYPLNNVIKDDIEIELYRSN